MGSWPLRGAIIRERQAAALHARIRRHVAGSAPFRQGPQARCPTRTDVARHFDRPQDIEWAYAAGRVWLLQARPMTALHHPRCAWTTVGSVSGG